MSDQELRELERAWRASGDPTDEARWQLARVRAAELEPWVRELIELLGRPLSARGGEAGEAAEGSDAGEAAEGSEAGRAGEAERERLREVLAALAEVSEEGRDRALVALARHAAQEPTCPPLVQRQLVVAAAALAARVLASGALGRDAAPVQVLPGALQAVWGGSVLSALAARLDGADPDPSWVDLTFVSIYPAPGQPPPPTPGSAAALAGALVPWLLGLEDPLTDPARGPA